MQVQAEVVQQLSIWRREAGLRGRATLDPRLFLAWCSENELLPTTQARSEYVNELASGAVPEA